MVIGHDDGETLHRALLILELSAPRHDIAGRQVLLRVDLLFRLRDETADDRGR